MESRETAIEIRNLDKVFHLSYADYKAREHRESDFYALSNITLDISKGDFVAIVGSNGSGKSTLLKILSGIIKPTRGSVKLQGTVSSVLDVGANLHPELSGRENALLQLRISGVKNQDTANVLEQIREMSGIGSYFYEPVKFYSTGMFMRLGFSLSFYVKSDIFLLDEILSVGDAEFRLKCLAHLKKLTIEKKTILYVTHNPAEALALCNSCIWLKDGKIEQSGEALPVIERYMEWQREKYLASKKESVKTNHPAAADITEKKTDGFYREWRDDAGPGNEILHLRTIAISQGNRFDSLYTDEELSIEVCFKKHSNDISISLLLAVTDQLEQPVFLSHNLNNIQRENHQGIFKHESGVFRMKCTVPANFLAAGSYKLALHFGKNPLLQNPHTDEAFRYDDDIYFHLQYRKENMDFIGKSMNGALRPALKWLYVKEE
ncbi:MAG TPA: ATP-binding cassette domain-containing protein [Chitinophagales bacterium]|nr:ATP-binding cassette domain-containing protein [Chitinophagales bacterium]